MIREGFTDFDIINFSKRPSYMPSKKESLGKVFDYQRATYHNFQSSFLKKIEDNKSVFARSNGICAQKINEAKTHLFINNPLKQV